MKPHLENLRSYGNRTVPVPLTLLDEHFLPALLGALIQYRALLDMPGFEYLAKEEVDRFERDIDTLIGIMEQGGWTPPEKKVASA